MNQLSNDGAVASLTPPALKDAIMAFSQLASLEVSTHDEALLPSLPSLLPAGTTIYVAHTPAASLDQVVRMALQVEQLGFRAAPHLVARRLADHSTLLTTLRSLRKGGVEQIMLVAGDLAHATGDFNSTLDVIDTGMLQAEGFKRVGVCGHPEGNKAISTPLLWRALSSKQAFAKQSGLDVYIVTQFGFDPTAVCTWEQLLTEHHVALPIHVGLAGPTPLPKLIKFAMQCGVRASLRNVMGHLSALSALTHMPTSPEEMLTGLVACRAQKHSTQIIKPHYYCFGGVKATARWLRSVQLGSFDISADSSRFSVALID